MEVADKTGRLTILPVPPRRAGGPAEAGWRTGRCVGVEPFVEGNDEG